MSEIFKAFKVKHGLVATTASIESLVLNGGSPITSVGELIGPQGPQGAVGAQGPTGAQGDVGATGPQGAQGSTGSQGSTGDTGPTGAQGFQGDIGSQGFQGDIGAQGSQGFQGDIGSQGFQGDIGAQGAQGDIGAQGAQGDIGAQGAQGEAGISADQALNTTDRVTFAVSTITNWIDLLPGSAPGGDEIVGTIAASDGSGWDPYADGQPHVNFYNGSGWIQVDNTTTFSTLWIKEKLQAEPTSILEVGLLVRNDAAFWDPLSDGIDHLLVYDATGNWVAVDAGGGSTGTVFAQLTANALTAGDSVGNITGDYGLLLGPYAGQNIDDNTNGGQVLAIGKEAFQYFPSEGQDNMAIGHKALRNFGWDTPGGTGSPNGGGSGNLAIGFEAGIDLLEGQGNVLIGYQAAGGETFLEDTVVIKTVAAERLRLTGTTATFNTNVLVENDGTGNVLPLIRAQFTPVDQPPSLAEGMLVVNDNTVWDPSSDSTNSLHYYDGSAWIKLGGGGSYDQSLNTTDNVQFNEVQVDDLLRYKRHSSPLGARTLSTGTIHISGDDGSFQTWTLQGDVTINEIQGAGATDTMARFTIRLIQDSVGGRTLTFSIGGNDIKWSGGMNTLSTASNAVDMLEIYLTGTGDNAANVYGHLIKDFKTP